MKLTKIFETFKYKISSMIKYPYNRLKWLHEKFQETDETDLAESAAKPKSLYDIWFDYCTEILQYGLSTTFIILTLFQFTGMIKLACLPIAIGLIRWLWLDFVGETVKAIRTK